MSRNDRAPKTKRRLKPHKPDFSLMFLAVSLLAFGLIMVLSAAAVQGFNSKQNTYYYVQQQLKWTFIGIAFASVAVAVPYRFWRRFARLGIVVSLILLTAVLFTDAGIAARGSARWIRILGINVQPSEIVKLALILFYAHMFDRYPIGKGKYLKNALVPVVVLMIILPLVYKQPDLGTTMVLLATSVAIFLQTELPLAWFLMFGPISIGGLIYLVRRTDYQWKRILVWWDPWAYAQNLGYQITNAQIAFGSGGLFGVGLGRSLQKYGFLPENYTDMIFAIIGEELGLLGTTFLLVLFFLFFARAFQISRECPDRFGQLLGFGITSALAIQTAINLAVVTGVLPVTGITLPLISYGGSSLSVTLVEIGLLLNISRYRKTPVSAGAENAGSSV